MKRLSARDDDGASLDDPGDSANRTPSQGAGLRSVRTFLSERPCLEDCQLGSRPHQDLCESVRIGELGPSPADSPLAERLAQRVPVSGIGNGRGRRTKTSPEITDRRIRSERRPRRLGGM